MKRKDVFIGISAALFIAAFSFLASQSPDGLEKVAEDQGFLHRGKAGVYSVFQDYALPGISNERLSVIFAGIAGVLTVFFTTLLVGRLLKSKT